MGCGKKRMGRGGFLKEKGVQREGKLGISEVI